VFATYLERCSIPILVFFFLFSMPISLFLRNTAFFVEALLLSVFVSFYNLPFLLPFLCVLQIQNRLKKIKTIKKIESNKAKLGSAMILVKCNAQWQLSYTNLKLVPFQEELSKISNDYKNRGYLMTSPGHSCTIAR